jgi:hypothetical protein
MELFFSVALAAFVVLALSGCALTFVLWLGSG